MKRESKQFFALVGSVAVLLLGWAIWLELMPTADIEPTRFPTAVLGAEDFITPASGLELAAGSGSGDEVAGDFVVPDIACRYQTLSYTGEIINPDVEAAFAAFYAIDDQANPVAAAMGDFKVISDDETVWELAPGLYTLAVDSLNTQWHFDLTCQ